MEINIESHKKMTLEEAQKKLAEINNTLTLYMKYKKATQEFIKQETDRLTGINSVEDRIIELYNDPDFIKEHGRRRYYFEIGNIVGYSQSSIQRFFDKQKKTK